MGPPGLLRKYYRKSLALQSFAEKQRVTLPLRTVQKDDHRKKSPKKVSFSSTGSKNGSERAEDNGV